jgi:hypothetical protein
LAASTGGATVALDVSVSRCTLKCAERCAAAAAVIDTDGDGHHHHHVTHDVDGDGVDAVGKMGNMIIIDESTMMYQLDAVIR